MSLLSTQTGRFDHVPNIRAAGKIIAMGPGEGAEYCLKSDIFKGEAPGTPEHIKKYRKSFQNQPGIKQIHPGMVDDQIPIADGARFGKKTFNSEHVTDIIKA